MKEKLKVPKLRFKEFSGEWEEKRYENIFKINQGLQIAISDRFLENPNGDRYFYITNEFLKDNSKNSYFIENPPINVLCDIDDILMTRTGNTGQVVTDVRGAFHNNFFKIKYNIEEYNKQFIVYILRSPKLQNKILSLAGQSTIPDLNHGDFYNIKSYFPSLPEQQKIAVFLSLVDEKIEKLTKKKELLEQYKKGVMQKIFSQELRFKDDNGNDFPEWEENELGEISEFTKGKNISKADITEEGIECIRYGELYTHYREKIINIISKTNIDVEHLVFSKANDIIIPSSGETSIDIATASCVMKDGVALGGDLNIIRTTQNGVFFSYYLNNVKKLEIANLAQGNSVVHLYSTQLKTLKVNVPHIEEQQKIADFLSVLDKKIDIVHRELGQVQEFKKGLLQKMFV